MVPISGQFTLLKLVLRGEAISIGQYALSYATPVLLTVVALAIVARLISRESVLAGK
jgi:hypothetical protein